VSTLAGGAGEVSALAGYQDGAFISEAKFNQPCGVAFEPSEGAWLVVADSRNNAIRKLDLTSKVVSTLAGVGPQSGVSWRDGPAALAVFNQPSGVSVHRDATGNFKVAVADSKNHAIRLIDMAVAHVRTLVGPNCEGETAARS